MMNVIRDTVYRKLQEYSHIPVSDEKRICKDLSIYGDDFEELIEELSNEIKFDINIFFVLFNEKNFYNPSEFYLKLPKIFHIDIEKLLKGKIVYQTIDSKGNDITVNELIQLLQEIIKAEGVNVIELQATKDRRQVSGDNDNSSTSHPLSQAKLQ